MAEPPASERTVAAVLHAGCSAGGDAATELSDKPVTLRFTWWGNDARTAATQEVIAAFEKEYPNITIEPQFTDWAGYWDKLATETAANDTPDIIQMDEKYIATYGDRGALLDLKSRSATQLDTSRLPRDGADDRHARRRAVRRPRRPHELLDRGEPRPPREGRRRGARRQDLDVGRPRRLGAKVSAAGGGASWGVAALGLRGRRPEQLGPPARRRAVQREGRGLDQARDPVSSWYQHCSTWSTPAATPPAATIIEKQSRWTRRVVHGHQHRLPSAPGGTAS